MAGCAAVSGQRQGQGTSPPAIVPLPGTGSPATASGSRPAAAACEGHQEEASSEKIPCSRPGCYELFPPDRRSPLKKFCCALCRKPYVVFASVKRVGNRLLLLLQPQNVGNRFAGRRPDSVSCRILKPQPARE